MNKEEFEDYLKNYIQHKSEKVFFWEMPYDLENEECGFVTYHFGKRIGQIIAVKNKQIIIRINDDQQKIIEGLENNDLMFSIALNTIKNKIFEISVIRREKPH